MAAPLTGQVALSGTAQVLDSGKTANSCVAFSIKCPSTNVGTAYIGPAGVTSSTGYPITPGDEFEYQRAFNTITPTLQLTPGDMFAVGTGGDVLAWFATP